MELLSLPTLEQQHKEAIYRLWNNEYPDHLQFSALSDLDVYLQDLETQHHYFISNEEHALIAWAFTFERDNDIWFAIIVDSAFHKTGIGRRLLDTLKLTQLTLNGWVTDHDRDVKANGNPYASPLPFYLKQGFTLLSDTRLEKEKLSAVKITWAQEL